MAQIQPFIQKALQSGKTEAEIVTFLKSKGHTDAEINNAFISPASSSVETAAQKATTIRQPLSTTEYVKSFFPKTIEDALASLGDITRTGAAIGLGIGTGAVTGNPLIGNATFSAVDQALRYATDKPTGSPILGTQNPVGAALEDALIGEIGGRFLNASGRMIKETVKPGAVVGRIKELNPTFSHYFEKANKAKFIEEVFNPKQNEKIQRETAKLAKLKTEQLIKETTGKDVPLTGSSELLEKEFNEEFKDQFYASVAASKAEGEMATLIAEGNPYTLQKQIVPAGTSASVVIDPSTGLPINITTPAQNATVTINGRTDLAGAVQKADQFVKEFTPTLGKTDPDNPLFRHANSLLEMLNVKRDALGNIDGFDPIGFKQAWDWKQTAGDLAFDSPSADLSRTASKFKELFHAIDDDILTSMKTWENGDTAQRAYQNAKAIVNQRYEIFQPNAVLGTSKKILLDNVDDIGDLRSSITNDLNKRLSDPILLKKTLGQTNFKLPTGQVIASNNMRQSLAAYNLKRMFNTATVTDTMGNTTFDPSKLHKAFQNPQMRETLNLLYGSKNRTRHEQFFKDLSFTLAKPGSFADKYVKTRLAFGTLGFSGGLITGFQTGNPYLGTAIAAIYPTGKGISYFLNKPTSARILAAAAKGGPLNMSNGAASRLLARAMAKTTVKVLTDDGIYHDAIVNSDGQLEDRD